MAPNTPGVDYADSPSAAESNGHRPSLKQSLASLLERVGEIREYATYFLDTKTDAIKNKLTWIGIYAALGIVGGAVAVTLIVTAAVLLLQGIAGGLAKLFGTDIWLGNLVVGLLVFVGVGLGAMIGMKSLSGTLKRKLMAKYELRHEEQRVRFGSDVQQRARERQERQA